MTGPHVRQSYPNPLGEEFKTPIGLDRPYVRIPLECSVVVGMLTVPQVAFAVIGGFLSRRFKITVTRR